VVGTHGRELVALVTAGIALALPTAASADVLFAEPGGVDDTSSNCTGGPTNPPCSLERAVEDVAVPDDQVIVAAGDYNETDQLNIVQGVTVRATDGQARPRVTSTAGMGESGINLSGTLHGIELHAAQPAADALHLNDGAVAERVFVESDTGNTCNFFGGTADATALLRDSVCWNTLNDIGCAVCLTIGLAADRTARLRNVTAAATQSGSARGILVQATCGGNNTIEGVNVIASAPSLDLEATTDPLPTAASADITLTHSNFDTTTTTGAGNTSTAGEGTNQDAQPLLADPASGDFHQLAGSPTIDAGVADPSLGSADIDGEPRTQGAAPDIGADELLPQAEPAPNVDDFPPDTKILKGPQKRTRKRKAKFQFGGSEPGLTFECSLDGKEFSSCASPEKFRRLKRTKHLFAVRAVDAAGNRDATPADRSWRIKKPKKPRKKK
jgi:hypothetical protein